MKGRIFTGNGGIKHDSIGGYPGDDFFGDFILLILFIEFVYDRLKAETSLHYHFALKKAKPRFVVNRGFA